MVVDTSIFIELLRTKDKTKTTLYNIPETEQIYISSITLYELLMGATSKEKLNDVKILTDDLPILSFNDVIAEEAANIYHNLRTTNKMIGFRDIFIAATCIVHKLP